MNTIPCCFYGAPESSTKDGRHSQLTVARCIKLEVHHEGKHMMVGISLYLPVSEKT